MFRKFFPIFVFTFKLNGGLYHMTFFFLFLFVSFHGQCCIKTVIYKAAINTDDSTKEYIGCTEGEFKTRYNGHTDSFRNIKKKIVQHQPVWCGEKCLNPKTKIKWTILKKTDQYSPGNKRCELCLTEKLFIIKEINNNNNINKRNEATHLCVHRNKHKLANIKFS